MNSKRKSVDFTVIGGGIFGVYAATWLAKQGLSVVLIEKEKELFKKASIVNQARLHGGYHYPRSVATAIMSDENKERFTKEHHNFINFQFEKYYAIDKYGSFTNSSQFERFCEYIDIKCNRVKEHELFNFHRIDALYSTTEYTFDPILLAEFYKEKLKQEKNIELFSFSKVIKAVKSGNKWEIEVQNLDTKQSIELESLAVINATYAGSNAINQLFDVKEIDLQHEIAEMAFVSSPQLKNIGLTVMDGQFGSIMPYGKSGLLSLSSVAYTHHKVSYENLPTFDCQNQNMACQPNFISICNECFAQPPSAYRKMSAQMNQYFSENVQWQYYFSKFTIKSKLKANHIDDGRPTEVSLLQETPDFYCIFAGKINSIYEIEKIVRL